MLVCPPTNGSKKVAWYCAFVAKLSTILYNSPIFYIFLWLFANNFSFQKIFVGNMIKLNINFDDFHMSKIIMKILGSKMFHRIPPNQSNIVPVDNEEIASH